MAKIILLLLLFINLLYSQDDQVSKITRINEFPSLSDTMFLAQPTQIQLDKEKNVYAIDFKQNCIFVFDSTGKFINKIGEKGSAPGEFDAPSEFNYVNGKLFVYDPQNGRFQILDKHGNYHTSFKVFQMLNSFVVSPSSENIFAVLNSDVNTFLPFNPGLMSIINKDGEITKGFGDYLFSEKKLTTLLSSSLMRFYDEKLYVLFEYYPILNIYDTNGELIRQIELGGNENDYLKRIELNYKWDKLQKNQSYYSARILFTSFEVTKKGIYAGLIDDNLIIDHYSHKGEFIKRYIKQYIDDKNIRFFLHDFKFKKITNEFFEIYVLSDKQAPSIEIFRITY